MRSAALAMNKIIFGGKQFFLGTVRMTREWLEPFGLTPARYDMITAIARDSAGIAQHALREVLGVTAATICRMLQSLEELGLIVRKPHPRNRRHRWVSITAAGLYALTEAIREITDVELDWSTTEILSTNPGHSDIDERCLREADEMFTRARHMLGPFATLSYPYEGRTLSDRLHDLSAGNLVGNVANATAENFAEAISAAKRAASRMLSG